MGFFARRIEKTQIFKIALRGRAIAPIRHTAQTKLQYMRICYTCAPLSPALGDVIGGDAKNGPTWNRNQEPYDLESHALPIAPQGPDYRTTDIGPWPCRGGQ